MSPTATATPSTRMAPTAPARPRHQPTPAPARRHLRPVPEVRARPERPTTRRRLRPQVALSMAIAAFFLILFSVALLQTVLVQGQIHLDGLRADVAETQARAQHLRAEVATGESPASIRDIAINELGMIESPLRYLSSPPEAVPVTP